MGRSRALLLGLVLGASSCDRPSGPQPVDAVSPMPRAEPAAAVSPRNNEWTRAAFEVARAEHRWTKPWPRPEPWAERSCAGRLSSDLTEGQRELSVRVQDDRWEKRDLLPYELTLGLSTQEVADARAVLERRGLAQAGVEELRATRASLEAWRTRPYVAVFHLLQYEPPKVVNRIDRIRPEWVAGLVSAWLVIHDTDQLEPICQVRVLARNDVRDAPVSRRLRSAVTARLESELIEETWRRARRQLALVTSDLRLPAPAKRPAVREASRPAESATRLSRAR